MPFHNNSNNNNNNNNNNNHEDDELSDFEKQEMNRMNVRSSISARSTTVIDYEGWKTAIRGVARRHHRTELN